MNGTVHTSVPRAQGGDFCARVIEESDQRVHGCFQCQRCGGGCPVAEAAGTTPNQFLRLLTLGLAREATANPLLWLCVGCSTCGARCPNAISTNEVIDCFRSLASRRRGIARDVRDVRLFHRFFMLQIRYLGRQHELFLIGALKAATGRFLKDMGLGAQMFMREKIPLLPHKITGIPAVRSIFKKRADRR